ncbi:MAG: hypothetical protein ACKPBA_10665 [Planctomycetota bacterium]
MSEAQALRGIERPAVEDWLLANAPGAAAPFRWELTAAGGSNLT